MKHIDGSIAGFAQNPSTWAQFPANDSMVQKYLQLDATWPTTSVKNLSTDKEMKRNCFRESFSGDFLLKITV
jgi:hypothetical protein